MFDISFCNAIPLFKMMFCNFGSPSFHDSCPITTEFPFCLGALQWTHKTHPSTVLKTQGPPFLLFITFTGSNASEQFALIKILIFASLPKSCFDTKLPPPINNFSLEQVFGSLTYFPLLMNFVPLTTSNPLITTDSSNLSLFSAFTVIFVFLPEIFSSFNNPFSIKVPSLQLSNMAYVSTTGLEPYFTLTGTTHMLIISDVVYVQLQDNISPLSSPSQTRVLFVLMLFLLLVLSLEVVFFSIFNLCRVVKCFS